MKLRILLIFCFAGISSFAQRFGVDAGYAYTLNTFKGVPYPYDLYHDLHCRQYVFPNFSFTSYVRVHRKIRICLGADIVKYRIKDVLGYTINQKPRYTFNYSVSELHIPLLVRVEAARFKNKHTLSFYGGIFGRLLGKRTGGFYRTSTEEFLEGVELVIHDEKQQYTCITGGVHQTFQIKSYLELYADVRVKYMPSYYYTHATFMYAGMPMQIANKFAFSLSAGISLFKPDKEKVTNNNPARLQD